MPRHGLVWRWSFDELERAAVMLAEIAQRRRGRFGMYDIHRVAHRFTMTQAHGASLRGALLRRNHIAVADSSNTRKYTYRMKGSDGEQAQRPATSAD